MKKKNSILGIAFGLLALAASLFLGGCGIFDSDDDDGLPTTPETGLVAGFRVTVTPPVANDGECRIRFVGAASGGAPGYAFAWDFGALPPRASQRSGSDKDATVEFVTTQTQIGTGTYGISLVVTDIKRATANVNGLVSFNCRAGDNPTTFNF